jgi:hypothetical protein
MVDVRQSFSQYWISAHCTSKRKVCQWALIWPSHNFYVEFVNEGQRKWTMTRCTLRHVRLLVHIHNSSFTNAGKVLHQAAALALDRLFHVFLYSFSLCRATLFSSDARKGRRKMFTTSTGWAKIESSQRTRKEGRKKALDLICFSLWLPAKYF